MTRKSVNLLIAAGIVLAAAYIIFYFTGSYDGATGAVTAAVPTAGHAVFAVVLVLLSLLALWQDKKHHK